MITQQKYVNTDICRAQKSLFDEEISLLVPEAENQDQSGKENCQANYLGIFEEINQEKMSEEELGLAIKYWSEESKSHVVVNKILDDLKTPANCSGICVSILNKVVGKKMKIMPFYKRADKRLSDIQKGSIFASLAVLQIADELMHRTKTDPLTSGMIWVTLLIPLL